MGDGYRLLVISFCGALATTVASSAEVAVVYFAGVFALQAIELTASDALTLGALILVALAFNLSRQEVQKAKTMTLLGVTSQLDRIDSGMKQISLKSEKSSVTLCGTDSTDRPAVNSATRSLSSQREPGIGITDSRAESTDTGSTHCRTECIDTDEIV